jgi:hypothetical protein
MGGVPAKAGDVAPSRRVHLKKAEVKEDLHTAPRAHVTRHDWLIRRFLWRPGPMRKALTVERDQAPARSHTCSGRRRRLGQGRGNRIEWLPTLPRRIRVACP